MCGIIGICKSQDFPLSSSTLYGSRDRVAHRGPDDSGSVLLSRQEGVWEEAQGDAGNWQVGLAFRRLAILDLSPAGRQPMSYRNRYWIVCNGEVFNFVELRDELKQLGHDFHSRSDTEVILAAYAEWGRSCFKKFRGMWGMMILDAVRNEVVLCRDRLGIKPLYFWQRRNMTAVVSEIKQLIELPGFRVKMNIRAASDFLSSGYENPSHTFFDAVHPIPAGTSLSINLTDLNQTIPEPYWHPERITISIHDKTEAGRLFTDKLTESVQIHLRSDVPVGCALSGGLDSSSIAALVHQLHQGRSSTLHSFTSTFPDTDIDEKEFADELARHIPLNQHFVTPDPKTFLQDLDRFVWIHDEPVGSLSIYASYCLARLTRHHHIPVTLNGQGGDEILSGYWQTYFLYLRELIKHWKWPTVARHYWGSVFFHGNPELIRQTPVMFRRYRERDRWRDRIRFFKNVEFPLSETFNQMLSLQGQERRVYEIRKMFLPRLLKWDDRNSMAFGVEGRYPFLDHELIELCLSFSPESLYQNGWVKWPMRVGLAGLLPEKILKRRVKLGFETPQNEWLRYSLRPSLEDWMRQDHPIHSILDPSAIRELAQSVWNARRADEETGQALFRMFIFDRWLERFGVDCSFS
ncbi:asparagine synthase (glutamine-hydrolyzing) [bacterium]|nr:asparagine synthase (glutamine-hydrolyzing) [bacterium]